MVFAAPRCLAWALSSTAFIVSVVLCIALPFAFSANPAGAAGAPAAMAADAPSAPVDLPAIQPVRTDSPRETLASFLRLARAMDLALEAYRKDPRRKYRDYMGALGAQSRELIDLTNVPKASRHEIGTDTVGYLSDVLRRVPLPPMERIPDAESFGPEDKRAIWRIPGTPLTIVRIAEGPRAEEFLFSARTVELAPTFLQNVRELPLRPGFVVESWSESVPQMVGPIIPAGLVAAVPDALRRLWLDTPLWKILVTIALTVVYVAVLVLLHRGIRAVTAGRDRKSRLLRLTTPAVMVAFVQLDRYLVGYQLNMSGRFAEINEFATTVFLYVAAVWIFWHLVNAVFEWATRSSAIPDESLDANLLRLSARVVGFVGGVAILLYGAQDLGLPLLGLVTGLGIGGLAVALAVRPTLENLVGGLILYTDRPVRVGDMCSFGAHTGFVESIGVRSTQIRGLDRTLIFVPNASFANMEIVNWGRCDKMLIHSTLGLRYETEPDQLRHVLVKLREMLHAHPKIESETVRVRFIGHGESSLDVQVRVYALTREWNEFYAIQEDISLRANEIVRKSGTGFAFPSRTLYMGRDGGLDTELGESAVEEVAAWRRYNRLPFPVLTSARVEELEGTLDYPPHGSPYADHETIEPTAAAERLSADPQEDEPDDGPDPSDETEHTDGTEPR